MTRFKFAVFACVAVVGSLLGLVAVLFGLDLYAHTRVERSVGVNRHGYRGAVAGTKAPGEIRVVMLGGSTVFGYSVELEDTIPALLERQLKAADPLASVVNLGFVGEGALTFVPTLQSYAYLDYDVVCLYEGYNDVMGDAEPNTFLLRHSSPVFRLTGYFPILPLVLREKAMALRYGDIGLAYHSSRSGRTQTVFRPGITDRTSATALETAAAITESLGRQLDRVSERAPASSPSGRGCPAPWSHYCASVAAAAQLALGAQKSVVVVSQPRLRNDRRERHADQQRTLAGMLAREFGGDPRLRYVDASEVVDLSSAAVSHDGMHLNLAGNTAVAATLLEPIRAAVRTQRQESR